MWQGALWDLLQPLVHADGAERLTDAMCKPADQRQMCRVSLRVYTTVCSAREVHNNKPAPFWKIRMQFGTPMLAAQLLLNAPLQRLGSLPVWRWRLVDATQLDNFRLDQATIPSVQ